MSLFSCCCCLEDATNNKHVSLNDKKYIIEETPTGDEASDTKNSKKLSIKDINTSKSTENYTTLDDSNITTTEKETNIKVNIDEKKTIEEKRSSITIPSLPPSVNVSISSTPADSPRSNLTTPLIGGMAPALKKKVSKKITVKVVYEDVATQKTITTKSNDGSIPETSIVTSEPSLPKLSSVKGSEILSEEVVIKSFFIGSYHHSELNGIVNVTLGTHSYDCKLSDGTTIDAHYTRGHVFSGHIDHGFELPDGSISWNENKPNNFCWFRIAGQYWHSELKCFIIVSPLKEDNNFNAMFDNGNTVKFVYNNGTLTNDNSEIGQIKNDGSIHWKGSIWSRLQNIVGQYHSSKLNTGVSVTLTGKNNFAANFYNIDLNLNIIYNGNLQYSNDAILIEGKSSLDGTIAWSDGNKWFSVAGHYVHSSLNVNITIYSHGETRYTAFFDNGAEVEFTYNNGSIHVSSNSLINANEIGKIDENGDILINNGAKIWKRY